MSTFLNEEKKKLLGTYLAQTVNRETPFYNRFIGANSPYLTALNTVMLDEVIEEYELADVLPRGAQMKTAEVNGFKRGSITPDVIQKALPLNPDDAVNLNAGESVIVIGDKEIPAAEYYRARTMKRLKNMMANSKEALSSSIFVNGKVTLPVSKDDLSYVASDYTPTAVDASAADFSFVAWMLKEIVSYRDTNQVLPQRIEVGIDIFDKLIKSDKFKEELEAFKSPIAGLDSNEQELIIANILNKKITLMPSARDLSGNLIDTSKKLIMSHDLCLIPAFAGINVKDSASKKGMRVAMQEYVGETEADEKNAQAEIFAKSAYVPILGAKGLIQRYNFTLA